MNDNIFGLMVENMLDFGDKVNCMERGVTHGLMAKNMKEITKMVSNRVMENSPGQVEIRTKVCGIKVSNMVMG